MSTRPVFPPANSALPPVVTELVVRWLPSPEDFGLDSTRVAAIKAANDIATAALLDMVAKRAAAETSTSVFNNACKTVRQLGGAAVRTIDAFAISSSNPAEIWDLAGIPAPKAPGTGPSPAQPTNLVATLDSLGQLTIKWKASNPRGISGIIYQVYRGLNGATPTALDVVGEKLFVDATVPVGTQSVTYIVRGKHGQRSGPLSSEFTVRFGTGGGGLFIASQGEGAPATPTTGKLAA